MNEIHNRKIANLQKYCNALTFFSSLFFTMAMITLGSIIEYWYRFLPSHDLVIGFLLLNGSLLIWRREKLKEIEQLKIENKINDT